MKSTADRYREAGMPPPRGEMPASLDLAEGMARMADALTSPTIVRRAARRTRKRTAATPIAPLAERVHDPATDGPVLPEIDPSAYGPDSVPLDTPDVDTTEETS